MSEKTSMILLDEGATWNGESKVVTYWSQLNVSAPQESIPLRTEKQAKEIRAEYLAWVHDLGRTPLGEKTLAAYLKVMNNLSYWWMTSIAIKSTFQNDSVYTVFKLRALEQLYLEKKCSGLVYCGNNQVLHETLKNWCRTLAHPYQKCRVANQNTPKNNNIRNWLRKLPNWFQALAYLIKNWYFRFRYITSIHPERAQKIQGEEAVTIVTYFPNIDREKTKRGEYWSRYWENLHLVLDKLPFKINWVWFYFESSGFKFEEAIPLRDTCNKTNAKKNQYFFIEEFLTPGVFWQTLKLYLKIYFKGLRLKKVQKAFRLKESKINFFPFMEKEWKASFFGNIAIEGAMRIAMFDHMAKTLPASPWGLFIWENLSWDFALMSAWRRHRQKTRILASAHGFFRDFDLRLFSDARDFDEIGEETIPLPDKLCVVNKAGISLLEKAGFPKDKIAKTEALRYLGLKGRHSAYKKPLPPTNRTLLVIMGITDRENILQFKLLGEAASNGGLKKYNQVLIKPHPALSPDGLKLVYECQFKFSIRNEPIDNLWPMVDVVYGANSTGASWEASWYGIPTIVVGAANSLNLNPLASFPKSSFVTSGFELTGQLKNPEIAEIPEDYFFQDDELNYWKGLLQK